ncbi:hypothetical protein Micbo1qcDRAFT_165897 [Microdochium bolleyi]|uniref:Uncharacterized protein n=1 Tax=Microdochium bolleyi TaxID=196109 RepID=A0A136IW73_9PEZI|nr:hypothetical protein Micbo1qcDRAFT_165897 [Microdochium bolleyi]
MLDEDEVVDKYIDMIKSLPVRGHTKFSEKGADHRFFAMRETIRLRTDLRVRADYSNPDAFNMHVFNDFHGYGIGEVVENVLSTFDNEFKKKRDDKSLKSMWANIAGLNHWFVEGDIMPWIGSDDGEKVKTTVEIVGKAILTAFNELDLAGHLKADSEIKDIGLVVSLIMHWANDMPQYGIDEVEWCQDVVAYAKKAGVDLVATGSYSAEKDLESLEEEHGEIAALKGAAKTDRWGWKKGFKKFKDSYGPIGGDKYNIMKWSRKERAAKAFDKKDPLAKFSDAEIASGDLMLG